MLESEYPLHAEHCALHEALYMALFRLSEELAAGSLRIDMDTHRFLRAWLVEHILKHDLAFSDYLAQRTKAMLASKQDSPPA
jgi:hemerythrin